MRAALIGAGKIAETGHLPGYAHAGVEIAALCDRNPAGLSRLGDRFAVERRYVDWRAMIADGGFDVVSICTPPAMHCEMTTTCLAHGYHVLVEKPMAVTLAECDEMIAAAESSNRMLMVAHNQRFRLQHVAARQVLDSGRLGRPRRVHAVFAHGGPERWTPSGAWYFDRATSGHGVLIDLGYHKIDLLRWLLGQEITEIHSLGATFEKPTSLDDTAAVVMRFDGGVIGTLQASWAHHPDVVDSVTVDCERGSLFVPSNPSEPLQIVDPDGTRSAVSCGKDDPGWSAGVRAFVEAIRSHQPSPVAGKEGRATLAAVLRAYGADAF